MTTETAHTRTTARLRALLAEKFADADAPTISTALLLLDIRTGEFELKLFARISGGRRGPQVCVWKSGGDRSPFAIEVSEAIQSHRLRAWRPGVDEVVIGRDITTNDATGEFGWAVKDLDAEG
ncbi:hypothetical protein [Streptomyces sp. t99]|uniref:hypothetical protein n=1 Tax=Streptomyces sp. t99 TaxID=1828172 RepID=UPI000BFB4DD2|nr:hypothetical protein [Streptomyces sp. t99]